MGSRVMVPRIRKMGGKMGDVRQKEEEKGVGFFSFLFLRLGDNRDFCVRVGRRCKQDLEFTSLWK